MCNMLGNNFNTSACYVIFEQIKFMHFGATFSYPHKEISPLACTAVLVPATSPQMWVPATRAGLPAPRRTIFYNQVDLNYIGEIK